MITTLTPKQQEFARAVFSGRYRYLLYGGGIRGGKTFGSIMLVLVLCRIFPGSRWAIVRKDLPTLKRNTLPSFDKLVPDGFIVKFNGQTQTATCANGSEILFFAESFNIDRDLNRWRGLEVNGFLLEEANELQYASFLKAIERAGSWIIPGASQQPPPLIMLTCNPSPGWVKEKFYDPWSIGALAEPYYFQPALVVDNPYLTPEYLASLRELPDAEYQRFVEGDWNVTQHPMQLIPYEWIRQCQVSAEVLAAEQGLRRLGVDVARYGDDLTTLALMEGKALRWIREYSQQSLEKTSQITLDALTVHSVPANRVVIDSVGIGAGVVDRLRGMGYHYIQEFVGGGRPVQDSFLRDDTVYTFGNRRSEGWWALREQLRLGELLLPEQLPPKLLQDLTAPHYEMRGDRTIVVDSKDKIKLTLGRSTDYGDALVYATCPLLPDPVWREETVRY